jgi:hypothetical protein
MSLIRVLATLVILGALALLFSRVAEALGRKVSG